VTELSASSDDELIRLHPPSEEPPPPRGPRRLRFLTIVLGVIAATVLATLGPLTWRILSQKDATLTMPATIGTLSRDDSAGAKATASDLVSALRAEIKLDSAAGAVYADESGGVSKSIMLFGGTALLWSPERELDTVMTLVEDAGDQLKDLSEVEAGPLGGVMKCGSSGISQDSVMAVCGWADHGSIALALFPGRGPADAAVLMRQLRAATLSR
jgi:hypothetical protein